MVKFIFFCLISVKSEPEEVTSAELYYPEPKKEKENKTPPKVLNSRKNKAKRTVTRTYEDEDGYLRKIYFHLLKYFKKKKMCSFYIISETVKEIEEYSVSEDEDMEIEPVSKTTPPIVIPIETEKSSSSGKSKKAAKPAAKAPKPGATKQGTLLNFFSKK